MSTISLRVWLTIIGIMIVVIVFVLQLRKNKTTSKLNKEKDISFAKKNAQEDAALAVTETEIIEEPIKTPTLSNHDEQESIANSDKVNEDDIAEHILVINLQYKVKPFLGKDVVQALTEAGLNYGDMNIFHYADTKTGINLFSISNAIAPGTLDPDIMMQTHTPSISMFFDLNQTEPMRTFEIMLDTAYNLSEQLNAKLLDDERNLLTMQTQEHYRDRIANYVRLHHN